MDVQVSRVFTSASNPNSFYGLKIWGYIDFSRVCRPLMRHYFLQEKTLLKKFYRYNFGEKGEN